jgi:hypothetical protein
MDLRQAPRTGALRFSSYCLFLFVILTFAAFSGLFSFAVASGGFVRLLEGW